MAKLNKQTAEAVAEASDSFELIPTGVYHARLMEVDATREGAKGPYWVWQYDIVEPGEAKGRKVWNNTSLSSAAQFAMKQTFDAFGVTTDTDTDDLMGKIVRVSVSSRTIQSGPRKGELANQVDRILPADEEFELEDDGPSDVQPEDIF